MPLEFVVGQSTVSRSRWAIALTVPLKSVNIYIVLIG